MIFEEMQVEAAAYWKCTVQEKGKEYHHLDEDYKFYRSDKEDVIDWAKSEVLKNENGNDKTSN